MVGPLAQKMADWKAASKVVGLVCLLVDWSAGQMDKRTAVMTVVVWVVVMVVLMAKWTVELLGIR